MQKIYIYNNVKYESCFPFLCKIVLGIMIVFMVGCGEDHLNNPLDKDNKPPMPISNVQWEAIAGGAIISYDIPNDPDLLYVMGEYKIRPGVRQEQKSSIYEPQMILRGYGDTLEHEVKLYAVDRSANKSDPVEVTIKPLISPVQKAFSTLNYFADFGGITVSLKNEGQDNLVISTLIKDSLGDWADYENHYSSLRDIDFSNRGLSAEPTIFGIYIKDRWNNLSDTLKKELTPLFEEELDKKQFKELKLPGDADNTRSLSGLWDGIVHGEAALSSFFRAADNNGMPARFNIDLGVKAKLSRFRTWQVDGSRIYAASNVKSFELWGSNDPSPDGSFEGWIKLGEYEVKKPSGLPLGEFTNDDVATASSGDEHIVPISAPEVRYVRFNILSTFVSPPNAKTGGAWMVEVSFWGQTIE